MITAGSFPGATRGPAFKVHGPAIGWLPVHAGVVLSMKSGILVLRKNSRILGGNAWPMEQRRYNERDLFKRIAAGDEDAFKAIFHRCNAKLYPFACKLTRSASAAEDIVQETFLRLWLHRTEVGQMERPEAWLYTVASNLSLSWLRTHAAEMRRDQRLGRHKNNNKEYIIDRLSLQETQQLLSRAITLLPPKRQEIYMLSREEGLNHKEIAEKLQLSQHTIKNQLVTALRFIRDYLRQESGIVIPLLLFFF